jgi:CheY-like chemotaxis protein
MAEPVQARPRILIVEDSIFVIMTLEAMCEDHGWDIVGPATCIDEAQVLVQADHFDAALLDVNLDGEMSWGIAAALLARGIPFAFGTGYDVTTILPEALKGSRIFSKPYRIHEIEHHVRLMLAPVAAG